MFGFALHTEIEEKNNQIFITNFKTNEFASYLRRRYKTNRLNEHMFRKLTYNGLVIDNFFAIELLYLLNEAYIGTNKKIKYFGNKSKLLEVYNLLKKKTWLKNITEEIIPPKLNLDKINEFNVSLKPHQLEFISDIYTQKRDQYRLNGYVLGSEPGTGKLLNSLVLAECLDKEIIIALCPKSIIDSAWVNDIAKFYKTEKRIWTSKSNLPITENYEYYIANYESIDKLLLLINFFKTKDTMIIVDECHNFKDYKGVRTKNLYELAKQTNCKDILLTSGTPIKALGVEMITILKLLDPYFTSEVETKFKAIYGMSKPVAIDLLNHRLGNIMFRRLKKDVLDLPDKIEKIEYIEIPNGDRYTLSNVKELVVEYSKERREFYNKNYKQYEDKFFNALSYYKENVIKDYKEIKEFEYYLNCIKMIKNRGHVDPAVKEIIVYVNQYEKENIIPNLPMDLKKDFVTSKAVVKYVELKILGEILGGLLNKLRSEMFQSMLEHSRLINIIQDAEKKTVCFTTYVDVAKTAYNYLESKKFKPLLITGETTKNVTSILDTFKKDIKYNPLIATIQTLSTGVTLVEANTVIFLNAVWRSTDMLQAQDRVHRIGQDTQVYIYKFILKTKEEQNLSTRMEDILSWSKEMFEGIVEGIDITNEKGIEKDNKEFNKIFELLKEELVNVMNLINTLNA